MKEHKSIPLPSYTEYPPEEMIKKSKEFYELVKRRRTVREFDTRPVPQEIIENGIRAAGTAPNGANMQPWHFVVVSDPHLKKQIREAAEKVEDEFYNRRAPESWLNAIEPMGTDEHKPYLEEAPYLIVVFTVRHHLDNDGEKIKHYYLSESVGIATGILLTSLHTSGLVTLTHTPSPMAFLRDLLGRPNTETPFMLVVAGYPKQDAKVPDISKKDLSEIATFL